MPASAQRRGAGTITPTSAGSQRNVYHSGHAPWGLQSHKPPIAAIAPQAHAAGRDRKSTRPNSSHGYISYAVFCLKKKKKKKQLNETYLRLYSHISDRLRICCNLTANTPLTTTPP